MRIRTVSYFWIASLEAQVCSTDFSTYNLCVCVYIVFFFSFVYLRLRINLLFDCV